MYEEQSQLQWGHNYVLLGSHAVVIRLAVYARHLSQPNTLVFQLFSESSHRTTHHQTARILAPIDPLPALKVLCPLWEYKAVTQESISTGLGFPHCHVKDCISVTVSLSAVSHGRIKRETRITRQYCAHAALLLGWTCLVLRGPRRCVVGTVWYGWCICTLLSSCK